MMCTLEVFPGSQHTHRNHLTGIANLARVDHLQLAILKCICWIWRGSASALTTVHLRAGLSLVLARRTTIFTRLWGPETLPRVSSYLCCSSGVQHLPSKTISHFIQASRMNNVWLVVFIQLVITKSRRTTIIKGNECHGHLKACYHHDTP